MDIIFASPVDAAEILDLQRLAYQTEAKLYKDYSIPPLTETLEELQKQFGTKHIWKVAMDGRIVGSVRAYEAGGTCHIERLIVHPNYQRRGLGTALLQNVEAAFPVAIRFELFTGDRSVQNLRLYERLGYHPFRQEQVNDRLVLVFLEKHRPIPR